MTITRYRKKPVEVDAVQWTGDNEAELVAFAGNLFMTIHPDDRDDDPEQTGAVFDELHNTWVRVYTGQSVIKGVKGEFYPIAPEVLAETYEPVASRQGQVTVNADDLKRALEALAKASHYWDGYGRDEHEVMARLRDELTQQSGETP